MARPFQDQLALREELDDLRDSRAIRDAAQADAAVRSLSLEETRAAQRARANGPNAA